MALRFWSILAALLLALAPLGGVQAQDDDDTDMEFEDDESEDEGGDSGDDEEDDSEDEEDDSEDEEYEDDEDDDEEYDEDDDEDEDSDEDYEDDEEDEDDEDDDGDDEDKKISIGLLVGYGIAIGPFEDLNPFGLGFGVRGSYLMDVGLDLQLGVKFNFFLGDSDTISGGMFQPDVERKLSYIPIVIEAGLPMDLGGVELIPGVGVGLALAGGDASGASLMLEPGAVLQFPMDDLFFGLDVRLPIVMSDPATSGLTFMVTGGMKF